MLPLIQKTSVPCSGCGAEKRFAGDGDHWETVQDPTSYCDCELTDEARTAIFDQAVKQLQELTRTHAAEQRGAGI